MLMGVELWEIKEIKFCVGGRRIMGGGEVLVLVGVEPWEVLALMGVGLRDYTRLSFMFCALIYRFNH